MKLVNATVSKSARAEPVGLLFEAGKVVLHGKFPELEEQLLGMMPAAIMKGRDDRLTAPMRWSGR